MFSIALIIMGMGTFLGVIANNIEIMSQREISKAAREN
jgi:hypothetical protein